MHTATAQVRREQTGQASRLAWVAGSEGKDPGIVQGVHIRIAGQRAPGRLLKQLAGLAMSDIDLLLTGPEGVNREPIAEFVHQQSSRAEAAFVAVNCAAIHDQMLENELFGHSDGVLFDQARAQGPVAAAEGGTLFLDQVQALSPPCQVKLLRFIQEKEYRRVGETRVHHTNVRVIAAVNADLPSAAPAQLVREDLLLCLRVIPITARPWWKRMLDFQSVLIQVIGLIGMCKTWRGEFKSRATEQAKSC